MMHMPVKYNEFIINLSIGNTDIDYMPAHIPISLIDNIFNKRVTGPNEHFIKK